MNHCFISYSNAKTEQEAVQFAIKLADKLKGEPPHIDVWVDNRSIQAGNWDEQVSDAIKSCICLLFVASPDSVTENSICADEVNWALKYKKVVIPLIVYKDVEVPFRLSRRKFVDFTGDFETSLSQLRNLITWLDSPEGVLESMKDRLVDAQRDLRRNPENAQRIQAELDELTEQIKRQEEIVKNPKAAEEKTEKNIQSGLERERQPEKPVAGKTSTRFINPPPGIAPNYFQDRYDEIKEIKKFLENDAQRLLTIVGRAGVGKTAMVCRLLKALERGELPDDLGEMKVDGIVYLSETGSHRVNFANVFADLSKLLPKDDAERLEGIYKNPQTSTGDKMRALLDAFPSGRVILLLDNFETLIDPESLSLRDSELSEALNTLLGGQHHAVKAVITTRIAPRDLAVSEPGRQHHLSLDEGLESPYAENVLREMDADGRVGLKTAPDALLNKAREKTRGYPRALEALYAILSVDRYTTLEELLEISLPEEVVQKLVGEAFNRLDPSAQKVMQALAVYNRPVSPAAIDYLLQPHLPSIDSALVLNRLVNMHFARREAGRYYLHPADKEYAFSIIPEKDLTTIPKERGQAGTKEKSKKSTAKTAKVAKKDFELLFESSRSLRASRLTAFTQHDLLNRAADYFAQARKPRAEWKKLDDLAAQLAEFELRCEAGDYDTAASVLTDIDGEYLLLWGHYRWMIQMHEKTTGKISDPLLRMMNLNGLGLAYRNLGDARKSIAYFEQGIPAAQDAKNRQAEDTFLGNIANAYLNLGDARKAIEYYEKALTIDLEISDRRGEGIDLCNLGNAYTQIGDVNKATEYYERALIISREIEDRTNEGAILSNLAGQYSNLAEYDKAITYYNESLQNAREIGNKYGESKRSNGLAGVLIEIGDLQNAIKHSQEAFQIGQEMSSLEVCIESSNTLGTALLFSKNFKDALQVVQEASKFDRPSFIFNITALHGIIALRQGERETAGEAFAKSIAQADEILAKTPEYYSALDAKGLSICGLVVCGGRLAVEGVAEAVEIFKKARRIAPHAGVVKSVLRLFDELVKCDEEGLLKGVREVIEATPLVE